MNLHTLATNSALLAVLTLLSRTPSRTKTRAEIGVPRRIVDSHRSGSQNGTRRMRDRCREKAPADLNLTAFIATDNATSTENNDSDTFALSYQQLNLLSSQTNDIYCRAIAWRSVHKPHAERADVFSTARLRLHLPYYRAPAVLCHFRVTPSVRIHNAVIM